MYQSCTTVFIFCGSGRCDIGIKIQSINVQWLYDIGAQGRLLARSPFGGWRQRCMLFAKRKQKNRHHGADSSVGDLRRATDLFFFMFRLMQSISHRMWCLCVALFEWDRWSQWEIKVDATFWRLQCQQQAIDNAGEVQGSKASLQSIPIICVVPIAVRIWCGETMGGLIWAESMSSVRHESRMMNVWQWALVGPCPGCHFLWCQCPRNSQRIGIIIKPRMRAFQGTIKQLLAPSTNCVLNFRKYIILSCPTSHVPAPVAPLRHFQNQNNSNRFWYLC